MPDFWAGSLFTNEKVGGADYEKLEKRVWVNRRQLLKSLFFGTTGFNGTYSG